MREKRILTLLPDEQAKKKFKLHGEHFLGIKKKVLKDRYASEDQYSVVGEVRNGKKEDLTIRQPAPMKVVEMPVGKEGSHCKLLYHTSGFLKVKGEVPGRDSYVRVLKLNFILFFLLFGILVGTVVGLLLLPPRTTPPAPTPIPIPVDSSVVTLDPPDDPQTPITDPNGGSVTMGYAKKARMDLQTGNIQIQFFNPYASTHDVVIELHVLIVDGDLKIAESGKIPVGTSLKVLSFNNGMILKEGSYQAFFKVRFYDPETGTQAKVDSVLKDIVLEVK